MANSKTWLRDTPGDVLALFREHKRGLTKAKVMALTGLSRTAASARVDILARAGILRSRDASPRGARGRPAEAFHLDPAFGTILVADTGATGMRVAAFDARGGMIAEDYETLDVAEGPEIILTRIVQRFGSLIDKLDVTRVLGIGIDLPGPIDLSTRRAITPPIMTGWHNFDIQGFLESHFDAPVIVEKDTNAMAVGEHRRQHPQIDAMLFIKLGTGIGAGMIVRGELYRGIDGAAGDIGHSQFVHVADDSTPLCRCGNRGCLEAYAGGWAMARDLTAAGYPCSSVNDVISLVREGNQKALDVVHHAAEIIGVAIADIVNILNPSLLVLGGQLAELDEFVLARVRRVVYGRAAPLASRALSIVSTQIEDPGVLGLAELVADEAFSSDRVDGSLSHLAAPFTSRLHQVAADVVN